MVSRYEEPQGPSVAVSPYEDRGAGWRIFAGIMLMLAGIFNFIDGIVTIANPTYIYYWSSTSGSATAASHHLVFGGINSWGWAILIVGIVEFVAAPAIFAGFAWGAVIGIFVAFCSSIAQLLWIGVFPWWSITVIIVDVLVIYGLATHGFNAAEGNLE
jgi:hypothetical protein